MLEMLHTFLDLYWVYWNVSCHDVGILLHFPCAPSPGGWFFSSSRLWRSMQPQTHTSCSFLVQIYQKNVGIKDEPC